MRVSMARFYVTTPIYYVNDVPHIGHAYTTVAGDVLTRWRRLWGDEVFYLTGTDEHVVEENYFFKLSRFTDRLLAHYAEHPDAVQPESRMNEVLGFIRGGLQDFSMSRTSINWGVPLPWDPKHVAYVWADALFNYCTAVGYADDPERFERWWPADYHLIGKDILRFHAVYWPAMLMSAGLEPPKCVFAHGWLLVSGEKMSKTRTNQIAPDR